MVTLYSGNITVNGFDAGIRRAVYPYKLLADKKSRLVAPLVSTNEAVLNLNYFLYMGSFPSTQYGWMGYVNKLSLMSNNITYVWEENDLMAYYGHMDNFTVIVVYEKDDRWLDFLNRYGLDDTGDVYLGTDFAALDESIQATGV
jgi:hypothetical protein